MFKKVEIIMKKVGIVSCDKWIDKLEEDNNLKNALINLGIDAKIISWQQPLEEKHDLLVLKSVWGYQNYYKEFKNWLLYVKNNNIPLANGVDMVLNNIMKNIQFNILEKNNVDFIDTIFIDQSKLLNKNIFDMLDDKSYVFKPTISGSGENTYLVTNSNDKSIPNTIQKEDIVKIYNKMLDDNSDCKIMIQPFISEINNGEYSCIFIDGKLTHTMLRFPNIFHEKRRTYLVNDAPDSIIELARVVERIKDFNNYLYMRVDMVLVNGKAKIMEVELADPDLLTKYIDDSNVKSNVIKTFAKKIERRVR
ncbi:MAG: RimK family alpha-L-glutamate ligase [Bacilli bacterium]